MVKRKAEPNSFIVPNSEGAVVVVNSAEVPTSSEPGVTTSVPTREELPTVLPHGHVIPTAATLAEGGSLDIQPLWDLLALAGYQTW